MHVQVGGLQILTNSPANQQKKTKIKTKRRLSQIIKQKKYGIIIKNSLSLS